jgi:hypothetical protein
MYSYPLDRLITLNSVINPLNVWAFSFNGIVAIHTGPITGLLNIQTCASVKKWFMIVSCRAHYVYKDINYNMITDGNLESIYTYFNNPDVLQTTVRPLGNSNGQ